MKTLCTLIPAYTVPVPYGCFNKEKQIDKEVYDHPDDPSQIVSYVAPLQPVRDKVIQCSSAGKFGWLQPVCRTACMYVSVCVCGNFTITSASSCTLYNECYRNGGGTVMDAFVSV